VRSRQSEVRILPTMTPILAKVTAIEQRGDQYQVIVQISPKYRGLFNTLAFGETIKPHSGSLKDGRLALVYHQNPGVNIGDPFPLWTSPLTSFIMENSPQIIWKVTFSYPPARSKIVT
jgi:hypothetical protein